MSRRQRTGPDNRTGYASRDEFATDNKLDIGENLGILHACLPNLTKLPLKGSPPHVEIPAHSVSLASAGTPLNSHPGPQHTSGVSSPGDAASIGLRQQRYYHWEHELSTLLRRALFQGVSAAARHVRVELHEQEVVLKGVVGSYYQKQLAQESIRKVQGVEQIRNEIEVSAPGYLPG